MKRRLPDFIIIGAMKCATTTLHEQLARQPGIGMSFPKEPNFFSDDPNYKRGLDWYGSIFGKTPENAILGESSTHYTKLPVYPKTVERIEQWLPNAKFVYVMRHPIDRLASHYWHDFLDGRIKCSIDESFETHPDLIDFGRYAMQLQPYFDAFGPNRVHPVFFERLVAEPQTELERLCKFLGCEERPTWHDGLGPQNTGNERMRQSRLRRALVNNPILTPIRRLLVPKPLAERAKGFWRVKQTRPPLSKQAVERLQDIFDPDLAKLGSWLGIPLDCESYHEQAATTESLGWRSLDMSKPNHDLAEMPA